MYALVFWIETKNKSVVNTADIIPEKEEGEISTVRYHDGKLYLAKIIRKSDDKEYLKCLSVTSDGELLVKGKCTSKRLALTEKNNLKRQNKIIKQKRIKKSHAQKTALLKSKTIFNSDSDSEFESRDFEEESRKRDNEKKAEHFLKHSTESYKNCSHYKSRGLHDDFLIESETNLSEQNDLQLPSDLVRSRNESDTYNKEYACEGNLSINNEKEAHSSRHFMNDDTEGNNITKSHKLYASKLIDQSKKMYCPNIVKQHHTKSKNIQVREDVSMERSLPIDRNCRRNRMFSDSDSCTDMSDGYEKEISITTSNNKIQNTEDNIVDNLIKCRQPGNGRVQLCRAFNVWIDSTELTMLYKWKNKPKEMTRRILKILVGVHNLKNMCARGNSKNKQSIPTDIMECVEYYVNKKCTVGLAPAEFTITVNYMCGSLRHTNKN